MGQIPHSLVELPVAHTTSMLYPQVCIIHWNILVTADYCT